MHYYYSNLYSKVQHLFAKFGMAMAILALQLLMALKYSKETLQKKFAIVIFNLFNVLELQKEFIMLKQFDLSMCKIVK